MQTPTKLLLSTLVVALAGAAISLAGATPARSPGGGAQLQEQPALSVAVTRLKATMLPVRVAANGGIAPWQEASIGAEANGLRLVEVHANVGDEVRRGQLLAVLAADTVKAELAQRRAAVAEAQVALAEAGGNAQRARALQDSGALSNQQIEQAVAAEGAARARLDAARAAEAAQALRLEQTRVLAPDDGVISARTAAVGAVTPASQELFRLIRRNRLEWRAEVAASDLARLQATRQVRITLAGGEIVEGRLRKLAPLVDTQTRNGLAYVDVLRNGSARAGMFAHGEFELGSSSAMTLPRTAVQAREGLHYVMRVDADSRVVQTKVRVGRQSAERIEILSGIHSAERVVAAGMAFLGDNDLVRIVEDSSRGLP